MAPTFSHPPAARLRLQVACSQLLGAGVVAGADAGALVCEEELISRASEPPSFLSGGGAAAKAAVKAALKGPQGAQLLEPLNPTQADVIRTALRRRLTLIQGPPGTGKTRTACALLAGCVALHASRPAEAAAAPVAASKKTKGRGRSGGRGRGGRGGLGDGSSSSSSSSSGGNGSGSGGDSGGGGGGPILAVASSNVAADEVLEGLLALGVRAVRVGQPASVRESLRNATLDARLERSEAVGAARARLKAAQDRGNAAGVALAFDAMRRVETAVAVRVLGGAQVVVASCVGAGRIAELVQVMPTRLPSARHLTAIRSPCSRHLLAT